jgi:sugar lactone lactonase YvrE
LSPLAGQGIITTIAGGAPFVFREGPALQAQLGEITSVAIDAAGHVYAADRSNRKVVRITPAGALTIVSGLDLAEISSARLAADPAGNLYVLEAGIRKRDAAGQVTTIADGGLSRPYAIALDSRGNLYVADTGNARIRRIAPDGAVTTIAGNGTCGFSGDGGPATAAQMCEPYGVAADDAGNLFIADGGNSRIRRVTADGVINTIAGNGQRGFSGDGGPATAAQITPFSGLAVDRAGAVYFADNHRLRRFTPGGVITTIAGAGAANFLGDGGPAANAALSRPEGVAVDASGAIYLADTGNRRVRQIAAGIINTMAGNGAFGVAGDGGPATAATLNLPYGLAFDRRGNLYFSESGSHRVRRMDTSGVVTTIAGRGPGFSGDGGPASEALLNSPADLAFDAAGSLYVADMNNGRVRRIGADGMIRTVAGGGPPDATGDGIPATSAYLAAPLGVAVDTAGNLYIGEALGGRLRKVAPDGIITTVATFFLGATHVTLDPAGNLYVGFPALGIARRDGGVLKIAPGGERTLFHGSMIRPGGMAFDGAGNLYVAESFEYRVLRVDRAGTSAAAAGTETPGFSGDGGPAAAAQLSSPVGVAVDSAGNLYVADSGNHRLRRVTPCTFELLPASRSFIASAGTGGFEVLAADGCAWTARSDAEWITVTTASGAGRNAVFFSFTDNRGPARSGTVSVAGQTFTVTQEAAGASVGTFEPRLTRRLAPGFYIAEATLAAGATGGYWGVEVITSLGQAAGGFNLGGGLSGAAANPGFGAFLLLTAQTVTANATAPLAPQARMTVRFLDAQRQALGATASGVSPVRLSKSLEPGFYVVEIVTDAPAPVNYSLGLEAEFFAGGVNTGGYLGPGIVGFGAFYVPEDQEVTIRMYGRNTYGAAGAGSLVLTLRDANRNVIQVVRE